VFGSADPDGRGDDEVSRQLSYRGHVRVDDAVATADVQPLAWELAPMASPKPSAGQFYLDNSQLSRERRIGSNLEPPLATWGSKADQDGAPRRIRGRKFYWRTDTPTAGHGAATSRGHKRAHHSPELTRTVQLIPTGTEFTTTVTFDNLSRAELGSVIAALDPRFLWPDSDVVTSVGGGKPFGFGSVSVTVERVTIESPAVRYLGSDGATPTVQDCMRAFVGDGGSGSDDPTVRGRGVVSAAARRNWPALRSALTFGYVDDALVWYPPGSGTRGSAGYDQGFDFWKKSSGTTADGEERHLVCPPSSAALPTEQVLHLNVRRLPGRDGGRGR
jgi:hypothetical protein